MITRSTQHEANEGKVKESESLSVEALPILGKPAAALESHLPVIIQVVFGQTLRDSEKINSAGFAPNFCWYPRRTKGN